VDVKKYYVHMVGSVVTTDDNDRFVLDVETYEDDLQNMFTVSRYYWLFYDVMLPVSFTGFCSAFQPQFHC